MHPQFYAKFRNEDVLAGKFDRKELGTWFPAKTK